MIRVSVLGATGYAGIELVRILSTHPEVSLSRLCSSSFAGQPLSSVYKNFKKIIDEPLSELDVDDVANNSDLVFTALPHGVSKTVIPALYEKGVKIIDLSGDFRYDDPEVYAKWYGEEHPNPELMKKAVYGLCELYRDDVKKTDIVANPGCYTTCSILGSAPLFANKLIRPSSIIIDAKSGVTGAGRSTSVDNSFCECTENMKGYKVIGHRHTSEIEQELSKLCGEEVIASFTPHLIPLKRGILATIYCDLIKDISQAELIELYKNYYKDEYFVRVYEGNELPETNHVAGSNFVDIAVRKDERTNRVLVISCLDNIVKGAAGQAVQNMNLMFGLDEKCGLNLKASAF